MWNIIESFIVFCRHFIDNFWRKSHIIQQDLGFELKVNAKVSVCKDKDKKFGIMAKAGLTSLGLSCVRSEIAWKKYCLTAAVIT